MTTQEVIEHTKQLMRLPTTADNPTALVAAIDYVAAIISEIPGVTIEHFERNGRPSILAYRGKKRPKEFDILLNAHLDVVPAKDEQFEPYEENGKLYGRGALDMKGTAMALIKVFCEYVNEAPYELALQIVCDEEIGGYDGVRLQLNEGVRSKFVVIGEYANDRNTIYNAARGLCWAEIAFKGKSAHGGHLWHGTNAVVKAGDFAGAILKRFPTPDKETWTTTASIASLTTPNDTYNKVPDKAIMKVDFRFTQEDPIFQSRESIETFIASIDPEAELVNLAVFEPAVNVEELNPYVQGLSAAMRKVSKVKPRFLGRPAGSDGRHYALYNTDIIEFGIYGKHSHSDGEYAELDSFENYCDIMAEFLRNPIPAKLKKQANTDAEPLQEKLLRKLIGMQTISENPKSSYQAFDFIEEFLQSRGMFVERYEKDGFRSVLATTIPGNKKPKVLLNAHVDVVPAPEKMFELKLKDGKFFGRGVMDMKHAIASYLTVVDALKDELNMLDFGLMITCDEEIGGNCGVRPLVQEEGWRPKVVIIPDGGNNWDLETFSKGVYWIRLEATGKRAHASRPWEGDSAIRRLLAAIKEIETLVPANPKPTDTLLSVGTIKGGTTANQIPSDASAMLDIRTGSLEDHKRFGPEITKICKRHSVVADVLVNDSPTVTDPEHPLVKPMVEIAEQVTGATHGTTYDFAVTDGRLFSQVGIPTIVINPECGGIHTDEEWVSRQGLAQFCKAIELYVRRVGQKKQTQPNKQGDIAMLASRLNKDNKPTYIWYATYGSGLPKENFLRQIQGGRPEGSARVYLGCTDQTPPKRDVFLSLPHDLYFAGVCEAWGGGGHINLDPRPSASARTIARAYLVTIEQFEEMAAQQNDRSMPLPLPYREAMQNGHATTGNGSGHYDELVYCGMRDGIPMFTLTAVQPELPYTAPNPVYTKLLCKGLSENANIDKQGVINYIMATPGVKKGYKKQDIAKIFDDFKH